MRLSIFNINEININIYSNSFTRILGKDLIENEDDRSTYVAIFNGSILGIASEKKGIVDYFKVLDVTRRRGVGTYLLSELVKKTLLKYPHVKINDKLYNTYSDFSKFINQFEHQNLIFTKPLTIL